MKNDLILYLVNTEFRENLYTSSLLQEVAQEWAVFMNNTTYNPSELKHYILKSMINRLAGRLDTLESQIHLPMVN